MMKMATITANELATELDTTPREVRKFLRADAKAQGTATPGKGARYQIERKQVASLKKRFAKWDEARKAPEADEAPEPTDAD
jgi:predicted transcriptional regulator